MLNRCRERWKREASDCFRPRRRWPHVITLDFIPRSNSNQIHDIQDIHATSSTPGQQKDRCFYTRERGAVATRLGLGDERVSPHRAVDHPPFPTILGFWIINACFSTVFTGISIQCPCPGNSNTFIEETFSRCLVHHQCLSQPNNIEQVSRTPATR